MNDSFDKNLASPFEKESIFLALQLFGYSILKVVKLQSFASYRESGKPKIDIVPLAHRYAQLIFDKSNIVPVSFLAERYGQFFQIDLLARDFFIIPEAALNSQTISHVGLEKDETIVSEEKMGDHRATSYHFDTL